MSHNDRITLPDCALPCNTSCDILCSLPYNPKECVIYIIHYFTTGIASLNSVTVNAKSCALYNFCIRLVLDKLIM